MSQFNKIPQQERIWMSHIVNYHEIFFTFIFRFRGVRGQVCYLGYNAIWNLVQTQLRMPNKGINIMRWGQWHNLLAGELELTWLRLQAERIF